jgi:hypothetical protein
MLAIHDQFTHQMRDRLQFTGMGLGLVRLLQDAECIEEARTALCALENGFQDVAEESEKPGQEEILAVRGGPISSLPCRRPRLRALPLPA